MILWSPCHCAESHTLRNANDSMLILPWCSDAAVRNNDVDTVANDDEAIDYSDITEVADDEEEKEQETVNGTSVAIKTESG